MTDDTARLKTAIQRCDRGEDGFECRASGDTFLLGLWGPLPEQWAGNLALHCFAAAFSIRSGEGLRVDRSRWAAAFTLVPGDQRRPHANVDFMKMARRAPRSIPSLPETSVEISVTEAHDAAAFARVRGPDSIGLLAELLGRFASFSLFPRRFILRTHGGTVDDWFWLEPAARLGRPGSHPWSSDFVR